MSPKNTMRIACTHATKAGGLPPSTGFTLVELMITVAIVAIIATVAYPSYREYINRSRRVEAQSVLMEASQYMERFFAENYRYDQNTAGVGVNDTSQFPARFSKSPKTGTAMYTITVPTVSPNAYVVRATRTGSMSTDKCGDFEITNTGTRSLRAGTYDSGLGTADQALAACWK